MLSLCCLHWNAKCGVATVTDDISINLTCTQFSLYGKYLLLKTWILTTVITANNTPGGAAANIKAPAAVPLLPQLINNNSSSSQHTRYHYTN